MSIKYLEEEKSSNNISKGYSVILNNKSISNLNPLEIEDNNSSKGIILRNAGRELLDFQSSFTLKENTKNNNFSQSVISLEHKGIKRKGHSLYDPYLIQVCKNALINEKKDLPNYKEIIHKVNTEYGIEEDKFNDNELYNSTQFYNSNIKTSNNNSNFNNSSNILKDINNSAMSTNIIEKR